MSQNRNFIFLRPSYAQLSDVPNSGWVDDGELGSVHDRIQRLRARENEESSQDWNQTWPRRQRTRSQGIEVYFILKHFLNPEFSIG